MHFTTILLTSLATLANATPNPEPENQPNHLAPRQTPGSDAFGLPNLPLTCTTAIIKVITSLPTPPANLLTAAGISGHNPCSVTVPQSLSSDYSSYSSRLSSWASQSSSEIRSALSKCPELSLLASQLPVCATGFLGGALGGSSSGSSSTGASSTGTGMSSTGTGMSSTGTGMSSTGTAASSTGGAATTGTGSGPTPTATGGASHENSAPFIALAVAAVVAAAL